MCFIFQGTKHVINTFVTTDISKRKTTDTSMTGEKEDKLKKPRSEDRGPRVYTTLFEWKQSAGKLDDHGRSASIS